jgi:hypothetical protein
LSEQRPLQDVAMLGFRGHASAGGTLLECAHDLFLDVSNDELGHCYH